MKGSFSELQIKSRLKSVFTDSHQVYLKTQQEEEFGKHKLINKFSKFEPWEANIFLQQKDNRPPCLT